MTITTGTRGDLSAASIDGFNITVDGAAGVSGNTTVLQDLSANGAISIGLGNATGASVTIGSADASKSFTLSATGETSGTITVDEAIQASGITVGLGTDLSFTASSLDTKDGSLVVTQNGGSGSVTLRSLDVVWCLYYFGQRLCDLTIGSASEAGTNGFSVGGVVTIDASLADSQDTLALRIFLHLRL